MTPAQYFRIASELLSRRPCRCLLFGAGRDTELFVRTNSGGRTVVLEQDDRWIAANQGLDCEFVNVNYSTRIDRGLEKPCPPLTGVPAWLMDEEWDVILVDAPHGFAPHLPGRQQSIYLASLLARPGTTLFVHDA